MSKFDIMETTVAKVQAAYLDGLQNNDQKNLGCCHKVRANLLHQFHHLCKPQGAGGGGCL